MSKLYLALLLVGLVNQTLGFSFWDDLRVTWGTTPTTPPGAYRRLPRNIIDAGQDGWVKEAGDDCHNGGKFNGFRYVHPSDNGVGILMDVNGFAGGIQSLIPHEELITEGSTTEWSEVPMYQNDTIDGQEYFVVTAYFVAPEMLCTKTNSKEGNIGSGSQVYFQNGYGVKDLKIAYKHRSDATANGWTVNNCIPGMGWHNFFAVDHYEDYNCRRIQPTCILYNEVGEMFGFCLTYQGTNKSPSYEHPSAPAVKFVLGKAPQCLLDQVTKIGASTIHVYFNNAPWRIGC